MKTLISRVADELTDAKLYSKYVEGLDNARKIQPDAISRAFTFWSNTIKVFYEAMVAHIMRVYDQKDSVGLKLLLQRIKENKVLFTNESFASRINVSVDSNTIVRGRIKESDFDAQLEKDIAYVDAKSNKVLDELRIMRNKSTFHIDEKCLLKERPDLNSILIKYDELIDLIDKGLKILNYYSYHFSSLTYAGYMLGEEDYKYVLEDIQKQLDNNDRR